MGNFCHAADFPFVQFKLYFQMKPSIVADEMFPEGAGPYMDIEEVRCLQTPTSFTWG